MMASAQQACTESRSIGQELGNWVRRQPAIGEESATDWLLYQMSERIPRVAYRKFTRHQEARSTGADWEWWLILHGGAVAMRVQAKKLVVNSDNYSGIAYA